MHASARLAPPVVHPAWLFALGAATVWAAAAWIVSRLGQFDRPELLATSVAFDLTVTVTLLAWLFPVRRGAWPAATLVPLFLVSLALARRLVPVEGDAFFAALGWVAAPAEAALFVWIGVRSARALREARRAGGDLDLLARLQLAARSAIPSRAVADVVAFEMAVLAYALGGSRAEHVPPGSVALPYHRRVAYGPVVAALAMVVAAETYPMHVLISRWHPTPAWIVTGLGAYSLLFLIADWRAASARPLLVDAERLIVRTGLRWNTVVPRSAIEAVERRPPSGGAPPLRAALLGGANLWLRLREPVVAEGVYGRKRTVTAIALGVDEPDRLVALLGPPAESGSAAAG